MLRQKTNSHVLTQELSWSSIDWISKFNGDVCTSRICYSIHIKWALLHQNNSSLQRPNIIHQVHPAEDWIYWSQTRLRGPEHHHPTMCWRKGLQQCADCTVPSLKGTRSLMTGEEEKSEGALKPWFTQTRLPINHVPVMTSDLSTEQNAHVQLMHYWDSRVF